MEYASVLRRTLLAAGLTLAATLLLCSPAWARRSRTESRPLYALPLMQAAPAADANELEELITAEDCRALAPAGFELSLLRADPSRFMQGGGMVLDPHGQSIVVHLQMQGQPGPEMPPDWSEAEDAWGEQRLLYPEYRCSLSLRACAPRRLDDLLQSFDSSAHNAYLRSLTSTLPGRNDLRLVSGVMTGLEIAGGARLARGREYLAWSSPLETPSSAQAPGQLDGELQAVLHSDGPYYILTARFSGVAFEDTLALTRNLAACAAGHLSGATFSAWTYAGEDLASAAESLPAEATAPPAAVVEPAEAAAKDPAAMPGLPGMEALRPRPEQSLELPELPAMEDAFRDEVPLKSSGDLWTET